MGHNQSLGAHGEKLVCYALQERGWDIMGTNIHNQFGELDIIARDKQGIIHVIEVKARRGDYFGTARESLTRTKFQKIMTAWQQLRQDRPGDFSGRFQYDFVAIDFGNVDQPLIEWFENIGREDIA
jgi:putative endonuclease